MSQFGALPEKTLNTPRTRNIDASDGGSIFKVGGPKTNEQIFFTYNQGRQWRSEKFEKRMGHNFHFFPEYFFRQNWFGAYLETRKLLGGPGHAPPENF